MEGYKLTKFEDIVVGDKNVLVNIDRNRDGDGFDHVSYAYGRVVEKVVDYIGIRHLVCENNDGERYKVYSKKRYYKIGY
jgi:hypothetical protein